MFTTEDFTLAGHKIPLTLTGFTENVVKYTQTITAVKHITDNYLKMLMPPL